MNSTDDTPLEAIPIGAQEYVPKIQKETVSDQSRPSFILLFELIVVVVSLMWLRFFIKNTGFS